ncbi:MAG: hypothetical protein M1819_005273 [Sarea resinae]|nr:MAG: hypothetical protein M1819_005273 [Sarea resinae]
MRQRFPHDCVLITTGSLLEQLAREDNAQYQNLDIHAEPSRNDHGDQGELFRSPRRDTVLDQGEYIVISNCIDVARPLFKEPTANRGDKHIAYSVLKDGMRIQQMQRMAVSLVSATLSSKMLTLVADESTDPESPHLLNGLILVYLEDSQSPPEWSKFSLLHKIREESETSDSAPKIKVPSGQGRAIQDPAIDRFTDDTIALERLRVPMEYILQLQSLRVHDEDIRRSPSLPNILSDPLLSKSWLNERLKQRWKLGYKSGFAEKRAQLRAQKTRAELEDEDENRRVDRAAHAIHRGIF